MTAPQQSAPVVEAGAGPSPADILARLHAPKGGAMPTSREQFQANLRHAEQARDAMLDDLRGLLAGREEWREWESVLSCNETGEDHQIHARRRIGAARGKGEDWLTPVFELWCTKTDGHGLITDEARFTSAAEALAWIETPRSDTTIIERAKAEADRRYAERDKVDIAGLAGRRVDFGRTGNGELFRVVEFEEIGRVRITDLGPRRWRIALNRRTRVVAPAEGEHDGKAVRSAIEEMHQEASTP